MKDTSSLTTFPERQHEPPQGSAMTAMTTTGGYPTAGGPTRFDFVASASSITSTASFVNMSTTASTLFGSTTAASAINFYQVEQLTFLWILFVFIVVGNATVLIALLLSKGHKSRMNFFIKHLASADLCVGLISVLTDIIWKITISWEAGLVACKIIRFLQCVVTYSSTYLLVALSLDRYDAITHPMNFSGSWKRARILVGVAWLLSAVFSSPVLFLFTLQEPPHYGTQCWIDFKEPWQWQVYMTLVAVTLFFIPTILISACYIIIVITIWKKGKAMQTTAAAAASSSGGGGHGKNTKGSSATDGEDQETRRASSRGLIPKAKVKTVKMTFVIISVFILCWSPYMIFDLLQVYKLIPESPTSMAIATFIQSLAPLNSAANPLIYCLFSTNIGATICNIVCCRKKPEVLPTGLTTSTHSSSQSRSTAALIASNASISASAARTRINGSSSTTLSGESSNKRANILHENNANMRPPSVKFGNVGSTSIQAKSTSGKATSFAVGAPITNATINPSTNTSQNETDAEDTSEKNNTLACHNDVCTIGDEKRQIRSNN